MILIELHPYRCRVGRQLVQDDSGDIIFGIDFTNVNLQTRQGLQTVAWCLLEKSPDFAHCKQRVEVIEPSSMTDGEIRIFY